MSKKKVFLTYERDLPLLEFLWRWKVATTAAVSKIFYSTAKPTTAYRRLWALEKGGFIRTMCDMRGEKFVWTLTKKGYSVVQARLPLLREEGYRSENIGHDLAVSAIHLGPTYKEIPREVELFSEQQLRRYALEVFPQWVPKTTVHRPDGYWRVTRKNGQQFTFALEVELSQKPNAAYEHVAEFYEQHSTIARTIWVTSHASLSKNISSIIQKQVNAEKTLHNFLTLDAIEKFGWKAQIEIGPEKGHKLEDLLFKSAQGELQAQTGLLMFQTWKSPYNKGTWPKFRPTDFSY